MSTPLTGSAETLNTLFRLLPFLAEQQDDQELVGYLQGGRADRLTRGQVLFQEEWRVTKIFIVVTGTVAEFKAGDIDRGVPLRESGEGSVLGIFDLVNDQRHSTTAYALGDVDVIIFDTTLINRLLFRFPQFRNQITRVDQISRLRSIPMLGGLDISTIGLLAEACSVAEWPVGTTIYKAGDLVDAIYLVDTGQVRLDWDSGERLWLANGGEFGFNNFAANVPPGDRYSLDHNAIAVTRVRAFAIPRRKFYAIAARNPEGMGRKLRQVRREAVDSVRVFADLTVEERVQLLGYMSHYHIPVTYQLLQQDGPVDSLWILLPHSRAIVRAVERENPADPSAQPTVAPESETPVEGLTYFGEYALRMEQPSSSTLEARGGSGWLRLHRQDLRACADQLGRPALIDKLKLVAADAPPDAAQPHRPFSWLQEGELVVLDVRRHWIALIGALLPAIITTTLATWAMAILIWETEFQWWQALLGFSLAVPLLVMWWWGIAEYLNDYIIVTNLRVFLQNKVILLREIRQMASLEQVQNVGLRRGFWGTRLGYATISVSTSSALGTIQFDRVARPNEVSTTITEQSRRRRFYFEAVSRSTIASLLENRYGLTLTLPAQVWPVGAKHAPAPRRLSFWARLRRAFLPPRRDPDAVDQITWHKHWLVLLGNIWLPVLLVFACIALAILFYVTLSWGDLPGWEVAMPLIMGVIPLLYIWWQVLDWRNDIYILDRDQVVDIEAMPFGFNENRKTARLEQIVDFSMTINGPIRQIFNYGDVLLQTAAKQGAFTFDSVSDPRGVIEIVRQRIEGVRHAQERAAMQQRRAELPDWFEISDRLQGSPRSSADQADAERRP